MREREQSKDNDASQTSEAEDNTEQSHGHTGAKYSKPSQKRTPSESGGETATTSTTGACNECGGRTTHYTETGEVICQDCGLVIDGTVIDRGPEWRAYNEQEKREKARTGAPLTELRHDKGLTTNIDWKNKDAYGRDISAEKRRQMSRLRKWDFRAKRDSTSNNISYAIGEIKRMGSVLGVPKDIQETAASLYREAHKNDLIPGRSIEGMASATLYISLRIHNEPRSLDEITSVARVERKPLQRAFRYICRELDIGLEPTDPSQYIPRFATDLDIPQTLTRTAEQLLNDLVDTHHVSGNDPTVLAASALYAASIVEGTLLTQAEVKEASDVTEVSIRSNYKMFLTESDETTLTSSDVDDDMTPIETAELLNDSVEYMSTIRSTMTPQSNPTTSTTANTEGSPQNPQATLSSSPECKGADQNNETKQRQMNSINVPCDIDGLSLPSTLCSESDLLSEINPEDESTYIREDVEYPDSEYNFTCPYCPQVTSTYIGALFHIISTHQESVSEDGIGVPSDYAVDPDICPSTDTAGQFVEQHTCDYSGQATETYIKLRFHQLRSHNGKKNDNDVPSTSSASETAYSDADYNFSCTECPCVFTSYQGLRIHMGHEHDISTDFSRAAYAVDSTDYPERTADTEQDDANGSDVIHDQGTIGNTDSRPRTTTDAENIVSRVDDLFDEYNHDFHPVIEHTTKSLLAVGGVDIGECKYRHIETAVAAALYAAVRLTAPVTDTSYTQRDIADITDVSPNPISQGYTAYLEVFDELNTQYETIQ